ncbi:LolA family protein [Sulfuriroseicoccus oceanibius]|uniref:Outer membrane lipoprotein carrier protein LolA n=1 Tax=Sulfuriroseicoccus oceanibius TaxID=2707525 RepID=A0A6B3LFL7_9BACT|nr:outer membrane lipoprotein carrier protein LolA [Sulfuriroseicoccus oceanibius]QQL45476.1 outer membrane lipoprotein carrier protein LolA [Sulfuriroseicoccus oceanibius]
MHANHVSLGKATVLVLLVLSLFCGPVAANQADAREVMTEWIAAQQETEAVEVSFVQDRRLRGLRKPMRSTGTFWLVKSGNMRWQIGDPPKTIAIYTDETVTVIRPSKGEYKQRQLVATEEGSETERMFLQTGLPTSLEQFEKFASVEGLTEVAVNPALTGVVLKLKDRKAASAVDRLVLYIDQKRQMLAGYEIAFRDKSEVITQFSKIAKKASIPADTFTEDVSGLKQVEWKK